jgi:hypothetical protein
VTPLGFVEHKKNEQSKVIQKMTLDPPPLVWNIYEMQKLVSRKRHIIYVTEVVRSEDPPPKPFPTLCALHYST